jgi:ApaG protein
MVQKISHGIRVEVEPFFQQDYSQPIHHEYMFAYRVKISNSNPFPVKLISRHWKIFDGVPRPVSVAIDQDGWRHVEGAGVLGMTPIIDPGGEYTYVSGANINSPIGRMEGQYTMVRVSDRSEMQIDIPRFDLVWPGILN